jgi:surface antigen
MRAGLAKVVALGSLLFALAGCASYSDTHYAAAEQPYATMPRETGRNEVENTGQKPIQCAPYAREHSSVKIFGDADTWWKQAANKFPRAQTPADGSILVLAGYAGPNRGHVAVVRKIISDREIRVDHANWLDDGSIYVNDPVEDISANNDWSAVRVWNIKTGSWGVRNYPVQGFILPPGASPDTPAPGDGLIARADIPAEN